MKKRSLVGVTVLLIFTTGIYGLYWFWKTKNELEEDYNVKLPAAVLLIIPIANLYWLYKYCDVFAKKVKNENSGVVRFLIFIVVPIIPIILVQSEYNKLAEVESHLNKIKPKRR